MKNTSAHSHTHLQKALFLDRDGVIVQYIPYLSHPDQVQLPDGAGLALKTWQDRGYKLIIITNQSGIARGYFSLEDVDAIHQCIKKKYAQFGVTFTDILLCPHHPNQGCHCRKPSPYLILEAAKRHQIALSQSFFIGDAPSDLDCAIQAGCHPVLVLTGRGATTHQEMSKKTQSISVYQQLSHTIELVR